MGTQFTSRLTKSDSKKLLTGISVVRASYVKRSGKGAKTVDQLTSDQKRKMAESTVTAVLDVVDEKAFVNTLASSNAFVEVLEWLKGLRTDAAFKGFENTIADYGLDSGKYALPVTGLNTALSNIVHSEKNEKDPFRVSIAAAARAVLADATIQKVDERAGESESHKLGRRFAKLDTQAVVNRYISSFLSDSFARMLSKADPNGTSTSVKDAGQLAQEWARRASRTVTSRAQDEGAILESKRIREMMAEELQKRLPKPVERPDENKQKKGDV